MPEQLGPFEAHTLPSGVTVYYRESDHSYWSEAYEDAKGWHGKGRLTGMSTVAAPYDFRPDALMKFAARRNGDGIAALCADGLSLDSAADMRAALAFLATGDSIWSALSDAKLLYSDITEQAATRGTNVHKHALHALARGQSIPSRRDLTDEEWGYARGIMRFWHEHEPMPLQAEQVVADLDLGVAGRLDLRAHLPLYGGVCLLDAKTSGFIPTKHHVQVAGYNRLADASGFGRADFLFILQVDPDGGYDLLPVHADDEDVEAAIRVYRRAGAISRAAGKDRKQREAVPA